MKNRKFKIGDRVQTNSTKDILTIVAYCKNPEKYLAKGKKYGHSGNCEVVYTSDGTIYIPSGEDNWWVEDSDLTLIKTNNNMEKGVVKLSLEDAKKLYEQGGNFRTIALSAYSEDELEYTPKDGDFVVSNNGCVIMILIYKYHKDRNATYYALTSDMRKNVSYNRCCDYFNVRPATEEEKNILLNKMYKDGKDWDPINKKIIHYRWRANLDEYFYYVHSNYFSGKLDVRSSRELNTANDNAMYVSHNYFRTKEEAQAIADKINNIFKEL